MRGRRVLLNIVPSGIFIFCLILGIKYWSVIIGSVGLLFQVASPLIIGFVMAYILNITMTFYETRLLNRYVERFRFVKKFKRILSIILTLLSFVLIVALLLVMVIPQMQTAISTMGKKIPEFIEEMLILLKELEQSQMYQLIGQFMEENRLHAEITMEDVGNVSKQVLGWLQKDGVSGTVGFVNMAVGTVVNLFMSIVFAFYLLAGKEDLHRQLKRLIHRFVPSHISKKMGHILTILDKNFHNFIVGQVMEAFVLGGLCMVGMMIFRFPYAIMIGVVNGATAIIPIFGAYAGMAVGFIMIFTESPVQALFFLVFMNVLQQIENQFIYPKVVGTSIGLPGIWIFVSLIIGSGLFGVTGMLVFIPLVATAYQLLREKVNEEKDLVGKVVNENNLPVKKMGNENRNMADGIK